MTQGELEKIPAGIVGAVNDLQIRIMEDMVRRIRANGFSTASADWQYTRLRQLGMSDEQIRAWIRELLKITDAEIDKIYSDDVYEQYMTHRRAYQIMGQQQIEYERNLELQQVIEGVKRQTKQEFRNMTQSMGFVSDYHGSRQMMSLSDYFRKTLDNAIMDIHSGAFDYNTVLKRTVEEMTRSGVRWIDYASGHHSRLAVAARRAVMTGFRQVQGKVNEQVMRDLNTEYVEVTVHIGARPSHQVWEGKVYRWNR